MPVQASKTRRGRPPSTKKENGTRAPRKMRRGRRPRGSISMPDQERLIQARARLQTHLENFARNQAFQFPVLWAQEAASMLTGHLTRHVLSPNGASSARDLKPLA